jgi:hypothetical protein
LNYSLPLPESTDEPSNKRTKLSDDAPSTIANKIEQGGYSSLRALQFDVDEISEHIIKPIREKEAATVSGSSIGMSTLRPADSELLARVLAFQKVVKALVQDDATSHPPKSRNGIQTNGFNVNGVKLEGEDDELLEEGKPVLSIFANAQGPKQLFSSFQQDIKVGPAGHISSKELDESVEVTLPILESALPSFITLSKRSNITSADKSADKRSQKLGERFGPPAGRQLPHLQVPKPSNKLITKSGSVNWIPHETLSKATSIVRQSYNWPSMKQASGRWLSYSGVSSGQDPQSPEAKRRQRDRALSTGAAKLPQSEESLLAEEQAKEEALFRSVFSSFAPSVDNSGAIVPDHVKNEIWWDRVGRQRAEKVFIDPALLDEDDEEVEKEDFSEQDKVFEDIVKNFDPALLPSLDEEKKRDDEVDTKLQEITDLIETLYSYQKIRNSQLPSTSVPITPVGARQPLSEIIGTPDTPSASEMDVYKSLKTKLALCVLDLPPYAIAKLNGEKYGDLAVSTSILLETDDDAGIMEDESSRAQTKPGVAHAAAPSQTITPRPVAPSYGPHTMTGTQYGRTPATAPVPGRGNSTYYPQQAAQPRTPSISYPRAGGVQNYGGYPQTAPRPSYPAGAASYAAAGRPSFPQTPQYNPSQAQQAIAANRAPYSQYYQSSTPQTGYGRQYQQGAVPNYGQRPQSQQYGYTPQPTQSPNMRTASPMQQNASNPATQFNRTPSAQPARTQFYGPPQASALGPSGFHTSMSPQEQQMLMDRQRAQVAIQNQARLTATPTANLSGTQPIPPYSPQRQVSGTPQPNPNFSQMNGTMGS